MNILIAEDDAISRRVLMLELKKLGHAVVEATDGASAWQMFDREPARIVISDWMMPGVDGLELCRKVRARLKTDYAYFILLTARVGRENKSVAMDAGVDDFLTKPLDRDELVTRLRVAGRIVDYTNQIRRLKGLLPICMYCKKIRDDRDYWQQIETYIHIQTGSDFSHSVCPECYAKQVQPQMEVFRAKQEKNA